ncbi:MAG: TonB-dependent receptor [Gammaproteobacteria bacterium]|nr:TonB-dependent receptor [Gammaproteobacteria bacterium]
MGATMSARGNGRPSRSWHTLGLTAVAGIGLGTAGIAASQEGASAPPVADQNTGLPEITVTAQKREQSINDVGLTITALTGDDLRNRQIWTLADLAVAVPGLSFTTSGSNTPVLTLRGVGFYETTLGAYPTVSVYVDQMPLPFPVLTTQVNFDVERVEVLKGPQGTLFGQNATGGAINFIAAKPTRKFEAGTSVSYGRFNTVDATGYVSGPLSDTLAARAAVHVVHGDGWQHGYYQNDRKNGAPEVYAGRVSLAWAPAERTNFLFSLNAWNDRSQPIAPKYFGLQAQSGGVVPPLLVNYPFAPNDPYSADYSAVHPPFSNNYFYQAGLRGDIGLSDALTLTLLTSYIDFRLHQNQGGDAVTVRDLDVYNQGGKVTSLSQEIRVSNTDPSRTRFVIGANFSKDRADEVAELDFSQASSNVAFGINTDIFTARQNMKNYAGFADVERDVSDRFAVKAGARYTKADRTSYNCDADQGFGSPPTYATGQFFEVLSSLFGKHPVQPYIPLQCFLLDPANGFALSPYRGSLSESNVSWRTGLDFKVRPGVLAYANVSKGYKAGSFGAIPGSVTTEYQPVTQESVLSYEVGLKGSFLERRLELNAAAFYYDYKDKQLRTKLIDPVFGIVDALVNIPKSKSQGIEADLTAAPLRGLTASAQFLYLDSKIIDYRGVNAAGQLANFSGANVPFSPKYQGSVAADYEVPLGAVYGFVGATVQYRDRSNAIVGFNEPSYQITGYTLIDLRAGVHGSDDRWRFQVWGKNVTDKYYWTNVVASYDTLGRYPALGAMYGATVSVRY